MLFRIWFLYVCKLGLIGFALILVGSIANAIPHAAIIRGIGLGLIVPISVFGAALGGMLAINPRLFRCPSCGERSQFLVHQRKPSVECTKCGLISCKRFEFSFQLEHEERYESDDG